ncbi:BapA prefix-like domain-containing protein [Ochrobactrum ciceri]|uniref:BapA prefix-like domain-containing protein n=1 Tax=Brucella ciceri TaxID=391287 RepID=A0ABX1DV18_9HYPH|nr:BapA prefix-like domain-containing protein [Brucella ciceri]
MEPRAIADYQKIGDDLVIRLHNGETIRIVHFMLIIRMAMIMI